MYVKEYLPEIIFVVAVGALGTYPNTTGALVFSVALLAIVSLKLIERLFAKSDDKIQAQIDKLKGDVERIVLRRGGN